MTKKKSTNKRVKRRWKKPFFITLLIIFFIIGAGIFYLLTNLDSIVQAVIKEYVSQTTLTKTIVKGVDIKLAEGSCKISELTIGNPKGFKTVNCISFKDLEVNLDILSLTQDVFVINNISIFNTSIFVELNKNNKNNLLELQKNLSKTINSQTPNNTEVEKEYNFHIRKIFLKKGKISALLVPLKNKTYQLKIPIIKMVNLRGNSTQITSQIVKKLTKIALQEMKRKGINFLLDKYGDQIKKNLNKNKGEILKGLNKIL